MSLRGLGTDPPAHLQGALRDLCPYLWPIGRQGTRDRLAAPKELYVNERKESPDQRELQVEIRARSLGFSAPGEKKPARSPIQSPGGAFNLKGVLTLFIQNNTNMQRRSKSIVVKQWGAAGAGSLPTDDVNSAGTRQGVAGARARPAEPAGLAREGLGCALSALQMTLCILVKYI